MNIKLKPTHFYIVGVQQRVQQPSDITAYVLQANFKTEARNWMSTNQYCSFELSTTDFYPNLQADVLVIGGGPAATWAAWSAASSGASVVLVDKGFCGTSGCAAASGNGVWYVPPESG